MSDTAFVQATLTEIYTVERFGSKKAAKTAAYDYMRKHVKEKPLTMRRIRAFFEGKAKVIRGEEKDAVRAARIEEARNEQRELLSRLAALDAALANIDEAFHGPQMAAHRASAAVVGGMDRPRNQE